MHVINLLNGKKFPVDVLPVENVIINRFEGLIFISIGEKKPVMVFINWS